MNLNIIDSLINRMKIQKNIVHGSPSEPGYNSIIGMLITKHENHLLGYFNTLTEEEQLEIYTLMSKNPNSYNMEILCWESYMTDWQRSAVRIMV